MGIDAIISLAVFGGLVVCISANVIHMPLAGLGVASSWRWAS
ncbi:hypothetical protein [Desulfomicrobium escambiense]|nr:hypothetical protein [Desulfomicrobium escambiense]